MNTLYTGRFAPSPTGPLHFGSLVAAMGSYLQARQQQGHWLLRIEDIDPPRCSHQAESQIIEALFKHGFQWDGEITRQSQRHHLYANALNKLIETQQVFACQCTRRKLKTEAKYGKDGIIYPGSCRQSKQVSKLTLDCSESAIRFNVKNQIVKFQDMIQGEITENIELEYGDFILKRRDQLYAYPLAVVVDDAEQSVTEIVRGADLLNSTSRQCLLQQKLNYNRPSYLHLPLVKNPDGSKLSKQHGAAEIRNDQALSNLINAWAFLKQPKLSEVSSISTFWQKAIPQWQPRLFTEHLNDH